MRGREQEELRAGKGFRDVLLLLLLLFLQEVQRWVGTELGIDVNDGMVIPASHAHTHVQPAHEHSKFNYFWGFFFGLESLKLKSNVQSQ